MFRDVEQNATAVQLLLERSGLSIFQGQEFFSKGKMQPAFERLWRNRGKLSHGELILVRAAFDLWTWQSNLPLFELSLITPWRAELVLSLFSAHCALDNGQAVDAWIEKHKAGKDGQG